MGCLRLTNLTLRGQPGPWPVLPRCLRPCTAPALAGHTGSTSCSLQAQRRLLPFVLACLPPRLHPVLPGTSQPLHASAQSPLHTGSIADGACPFGPGSLVRALACPASHPV